MSSVDSILTRLIDFGPTAATVIGAIVVIAVARLILNRRLASQADQGFRVQMAVLVLSLVGLVAVILTLPVKAETTVQLLSLLGLLLSAAIALSATTFVGNIMAGLMLRAVKNFRPGDFIRVGEQFGRVSERGLFHIEIQTEDRDLTTMPNLYLVTNPVKVIRSDGTLITCEVSLGYDVSRRRICAALVQAATDTGLNEPFVHVTELGDYSVTYRVAGMLTEVKSLLTTRSRLREMTLDRLHESGIEIVSPTFMNQRVLDPGRAFIPAGEASVADVTTGTESPEAVVFDKADEAESLENLRLRQEQIKVELEALKKAADAAVLDSEREPIVKQRDSLKKRLENLTAYIARRTEEDKQS